MKSPRVLMALLCLLSSGANVPAAQTPAAQTPATPGAPPIPGMKPAPPCMSKEVYRQLDFWVGDWDVTNPKGQKAGTNSIQKTLDGCLLLENWSGTGGNSGKSMNYFDPATKRWAQIWVDGGGDVISFTAEFKDGAMRFQGTHADKAGTKALSRMSLTPLPNGHVRQFIEESRDEGRTWAVWFEGDYAPRQ